MPGSKDQGTEFEFTVVQKLYQGTDPGRGCNLSWVSFFVSFLDKQKRKNKVIKKTLQFNSGIRYLLITLRNIQYTMLNFQCSTNSPF
jgi:hypothetical protein